MNSADLPKLIATSVVRGSEKGQSHGGVYTIDFGKQELLQHIDWNTSNIDFSGRGWDRGLRGIEFGNDRVYIAASDELFCYDPKFRLIESFRNPYLKHCHEISMHDGLLMMTSTGFDSLLAFDTRKKKFSWGMHLAFDGLEWSSKAYDPSAEKGPQPSNQHHLNMVCSNTSGIYFSGLKTRAMLALNNDMSISEVCNLPAGTHNAQPFRDGVLFNDTNNNAVRYVGRGGADTAFAIPSYPEYELQNQGVDDSRIARQQFGRGLCALDNTLVCGGSSPSTITVYNLDEGHQLASVNLSMDIRNAIHGLEIWPFN